MKFLLNPPKEYRPVPFWSWNDRLDIDLLKQQIFAMKNAGIGGFFMHARGGLLTEYMGENWFECISECIKYAKEISMDAWIYDEEGWPSGFAGGRIPEKGEKYQMRYLTKENGTIVERVNPYYIDILNESVVKAFLDETHQQYYSRLKQDFADVSGFFTDEPQFARNEIPFSKILPKKFKDKYGYDISAVIDMLFEDKQGAQRVRYHYWSLVNELITESFFKQIYLWCSKNNCKFTGHSMMENSLLSQMRANAGVMPSYEYMHMPGIDHLGRCIESPIMPKQVSSAAIQLSKEHVLTESFALCGWNVSFEELKWIAGWQMVNGVNLICPHLEGYTLRGLRKRDYPPSLFIQQSWFEAYGFLNDYFARIGMILAKGESRAEVLLIHPIKSAFLLYNKTDNSKAEKLSDDLVNTVNMLSNNHIDWHFGDETIIKKHGKISGDRFVVGKCEYKAVMLPSMINIDSDTLALLLEFAENGGRIYSAGDFPIYCNGENSMELMLLKSFTFFPNNVLNELDLLKNISVQNENGEIADIHCTSRTLGGKTYIYIVNLSAEKSYNASVSVKGCGFFSVLNLEDITQSYLECKKRLDTVNFNLEFLPMQSYMLIEDDVKKSDKAAKITTLSDTFEIVNPPLNSLTLDFCEYKIDDGQWQEKKAVITVFNELLKLKKEVAISLRFDFTVNNLPSEIFICLETPLKFEITVNGNEVTYVNEGFWIDSEFKKVSIEKYILKGKNQITLKTNFYQRQEVYDVLFGENVHESLKNKLTLDTELEAVYIVGDFGVFSESGYKNGERDTSFTNGPFVIDAMPKTVNRGDLTKQGFCFFAEKLTLKQKINVKKEGKILLDIGSVKAPAIKLSVNNNEKILAWRPYMADISDCASSGENEIEITLYSSLRNLLGPHHHIKGECLRVGPGSFTDTADWCDGNVKESIWRGNDYCFTAFGIM